MCFLWFRYFIGVGLVCPTTMAGIVTRKSGLGSFKLWFGMKLSQPFFKQILHQGIFSFFGVLMFISTSVFPTKKLVCPFQLKCLWSGILPGGCFDGAAQKV